MNFQARKNGSGFTLIELLVVVSIIAILAAVVSVNALASNQKSRDAKRQADVRTLQTAIELYKQKYGRYPEGCLGSDRWSGQQGTAYACPGGSTQYIIGHVDSSDLDGDGDTTERLTFAPEFIPVLPFDKKLNGTNSGYVYMTNANGTVYKVMAMNTVESERLDTVAAYTHPMRSCDMRATENSDGSYSEQTNSWCYRTSRNIGYGTNAVPAHCRYDNTRFQTSYGLWGGIAPCTGSCAITAGSGANTSEAWTEIIICQ